MPGLDAVRQPLAMESYRCVEGPRFSTRRFFTIMARRDCCERLGGNEIFHENSLGCHELHLARRYMNAR